MKCPYYISKEITKTQTDEETTVNLTRTELGDCLKEDCAVYKNGSCHYNDRTAETEFLTALTNILTEAIKINAEKEKEKFKSQLFDLMNDTI